MCGWDSELLSASLKPFSQFMEILCIQNRTKMPLVRVVVMDRTIGRAVAIEVCRDLVTKEIEDDPVI